jgi:hypothetical protein
MFAEEGMKMIITATVRSSCHINICKGRQEVL